MSTSIKITGEEDLQISKVGIHQGQYEGFHPTSDKHIVQRHQDYLEVGEAD